ncbi:Flp family type IVb pilin [Desulfonatronovibrio magnus]|uniref:Flp family type IVb pilin n=1 Tax=Desulfonatronovibrio magnus TaxID=698827 RepID=UPI0005EAF819|nr:Flp family type IVb pilin [Desulfonatronovibrio magnus]
MKNTRQKKEKKIVGQESMELRHNDVSYGNQTGATAVEYALVIAVVLAVVIAAATFMGDPLQDFFEAAVQQVQGWMGRQPSAN